MLPQPFAPLRDAVAALARDAGAAILDVYRGAFDVQLKGDATPVTEADLRAHALLTRGLRALTPRLPVLSEEQAAAPYEVRRAWTRFWLVDPLDGTREFVNRTGEFSVNVALVEAGRPVFGVVHDPLAAVDYAGAPGAGAWRREGEGPWRPLRVAAPTDRTLRVLTSRSHAGGRTRAWLDRIATDWDVRTTARGSAIKACLVAAGEAHLYARLGPTSEWDTAASQAVLEAAGGVLRAIDGDAPLRYNKPDLRNPEFYAAWGPEAPHP
ncbi:MAG: 3'(2'),5'-bisphosphate nucleotidase CysQ [Trueperaceae bacterium]|nr:3'(2'),5'-bisphosphate nucleotidase CysQ [Trueperaceae bacterium]